MSGDRPPRRRWRRIGCVGVAVLAAMVLVWSVALVAVAISRARGEQITQYETRRVLPGGTELDQAAGRVVLDLVVGELEVLPGEPGGPARIGGGPADPSDRTASAGSTGSSEGSISGAEGGSAGAGRPSAGGSTGGTGGNKKSGISKVTGMNGAGPSVSVAGPDSAPTVGAMSTNAAISSRFARSAGSA